MNQNVQITLQDPVRATEAIEDFISNQSRKVGIDSAIVGLSGGIDSSLTALLTRRALGDGKVEVVFMPERTTPKRDKEDVEKMANKYNLGFKEIEIDDYLNPYTRDLPSFSELTEANIKARIRMTLLYALANEKDGMVVGTGNRSEWLLGYFTKYGDGAADIAPLLHLFKTEVKELARHLELPESIIEKPPSAGLWNGQTDEEELGGSYEDLDRVLYCKTELGLSREETAEKLDLDEEFIDHVYSLVNDTEHKRKNPPSLDR